MTLAKEIAEQPGVVRRLLDEGWPDAKVLGRALARVEHITLAARGSSDNAATYGKYMLESVAAVVTALAAPSLVTRYDSPPSFGRGRSEEHTSELQSQSNLVCRLLLEKKKTSEPLRAGRSSRRALQVPRSERPTLHSKTEESAGFRSIEWPAARACVLFVLYRPSTRR